MAFTLRTKDLPFMTGKYPSEEEKRKELPYFLTLSGSITCVMNHRACVLAKDGEGQGCAHLPRIAVCLFFKKKKKNLEKYTFPQGDFHRRLLTSARDFSKDFSGVLIHYIPDSVSQSYAINNSQKVSSDSISGPK